MNSKLLLAAIAALAVLGCQNPGNSRPRKRRRPLIDFGGGKEKPTADPARIFIGKDAEELATANPGALKSGTSENLKGFDEYQSLDEMLVAYENAKVGERGSMLKYILSQGKEAEQAIQRRSSALLLRHEVYQELMEKLVRRSRGIEELSGMEFHSDGLENDFVARKYRWAVDRFSEGDFLGARRVTKALLELAPDSPLAPKIRRLRKQSREHLLRETVLYTELFAPKYIAADRDLEVTLRLTNRSPDQVLIVPSASSNGKIGVLEIAYEELFIGGTRSKNKTSVAIQEKKTLSLKSGESIAIKMTIPHMHKGKSASVIGRYDIGGYLRPFELQQGDEVLPYLVPIYGFRVHVVQRQDIALVRYPVASLKDSLDGLEKFYRAVEDPKLRRLGRNKLPKTDRLLRELYLTAVLGGAWKRKETLAVIEKVLPKVRKEVEPTLCAALSSITEDPFIYSSKEWLEWFAKRRRRGVDRPGR